MALNIFPAGTRGRIWALSIYVAGKLGNAYLRYPNRQPATCFLLTATLAMLAIPVLPVKWKAS